MTIRGKKVNPMTTNEIKLKIHEESDLLSPYDPDQKLLSEDVSDYLIQCYEHKHRTIRENLVVRIISDTPVDEERVRQALRNHCALEQEINRHEIMMETFREICLAVVGLGLLSLWIFLSRTNEGLWMEVISIMGWVAIWEATSIAIMRRPELFHVKKTYERTSKAKIIIEVAEAEG